MPSSLSAVGMSVQRVFGTLLNVSVIHIHSKMIKITFVEQESSYSQCGLQKYTHKTANLESSVFNLYIKIASTPNIVFFR